MFGMRVLIHPGRAIYCDPSSRLLILEEFQKIRVFSLGGTCRYSNSKDCSAAGPTYLIGTSVQAAIGKSHCICCLQSTLLDPPKRPP